MPQRRSAAGSQNTFLDTIATRFDGIHSNFVLGNAQANGWPIVYCSDGFCELTGFARAHVMARGSGCRFLYGSDTAEAEIAKIAEALEVKRELKTEIQLYRKTGTLFWCLLDIVPIKNEKGDVVLFLVSHKDITKEKHRRENDGDGDGDSHSKGSSDDSSSDDDQLAENKEGLPENYNYGRRRSRAVLYHISGQLNKQNKAKTKLQQLNRLASQMPEYKVQEVKQSRFIIVHYGIFKIGWDWLILLCTFYIAILVPFNAAFRKSGRFRDFMYIDAAVEVLFAIDIFLNFRTTYLNKSGQVVYEPRLIAIYYIRGWFLLDLLAAIPFDLLYAFSVDTATMVHLLKLARLLRLARLLQKMERYSQYSVLVLALLMCMFALSAHWLACIWYAIGKSELDLTNEHWTASWLYELSERLDNVIITMDSNSTNVTNVPDIMTSYITALYFTCSSLTSVGFGNVSANTNVEKIFSVCAMLVGAIAHAVVFGNVTTIIQRMYARRAIFHSKTKDLKDFFRIHHFPKPLKHRMSDYFQAMWSINNGIDVRQILNDFPEEMRGEIGLHLHGEILSLPIFQQAPPGCLKSVALQTDRLVCGPGEFILRKGDAINCIYYVCSGSMEVLKDEQVVAILGKGDIFGSDVDFDDPVPISGCDVRSLAYCELMCIQMKGLIDTLVIYPDFAEIFTTELPNDLTYNLREGHEDISDDESSTAAPVITLPSISEDEEEEEDDEKTTGNNSLLQIPRDNLAHLRRQHRLATASQGQLLEDEEDEETNKGGSQSQSSPLLTQLAGAGRGEHPSMTTNDWLASRGRLPNGHIAATLGLRLAKHQNKLKQWINKARKNREEANLLAASTTPSTPVAAPTLISPPTPPAPRPKPSPIAATLALRRTQTSGPNRLAHRRASRGEKLRACRTLPTLNSVSTERSIEQVMVHTLQMELEGTRDTVIGLERRLDDLHEDLSSISRNVDSLLRLVSQSPNPMYLSSHSLQPSYYNQSPLHHGSNLLYGNQPSFYFSQSTVGDARELSSGQSNSPAPENWLPQQQQQQAAVASGGGGGGGGTGGGSGGGGSSQQQQQQYLSPFQGSGGANANTTTSRNSSGTPNHTASPRFIFSPVSSSATTAGGPPTLNNCGVASCCCCCGSGGGGGVNNARHCTSGVQCSGGGSCVKSALVGNSAYRGSNTADSSPAGSLISPLAQEACPGYPHPLPPHHHQHHQHHHHQQHPHPLHHHHHPHPHPHNHPQQQHHHLEGELPLTATSCCDNNSSGNKNVGDDDANAKIHAQGESVLRGSSSDNNLQDNNNSNSSSSSNNCLKHDPHSAFVASTTSTSTVITMDDPQKDSSSRRSSSTSCSGGGNGSVSKPHGEHHTATGDRAVSPSSVRRATPSPPLLRGKSPPRPSNLSPLLPVRHDFSFSSNRSSSNNSSSNNLDILKNNNNNIFNRHSTGSTYNNNNNDLSSNAGKQRISRSHSDNVECNSLHVPRPYASASSSSMSSVNSATVHAPFTHDYYNLTQLEPCDVALGHCAKAASLGSREFNPSSTNEQAATTTKTDDDGKDEIIEGVTPTPMHAHRGGGGGGGGGESSSSPPSHPSRMIASGSLILDPSCKDCSDENLSVKYAGSLGQRTPSVTDVFTANDKNIQESIPLIPSPPSRQEGDEEDNNDEYDDTDTATMSPISPSSKLLSTKTGSNNNLLPIIPTTTTGTKTKTKSKSKPKPKPIKKKSLTGGSSSENIIVTSLDPCCDVMVTRRGSSNNNNNNDGSGSSSSSISSSSSSDRRKNSLNRLSSPSLHRSSANSLMINGDENKTGGFPRSKSTSALQLQPKKQQPQQQQQQHQQQQTSTVTDTQGGLASPDATQVQQVVGDSKDPTTPTTSAGTEQLHQHDPSHPHHHQQQQRRVVAPLSQTESLSEESIVEDTNSTRV